MKAENQVIGFDGKVISLTRYGTHIHTHKLYTEIFGPMQAHIAFRQMLKCTERYRRTYTTLKYPEGNRVRDNTFDSHLTRY